uniref:Uncharacterized protein n=1 Tax=Anguilla anguilla TaxID=7936 RepID=A0A0E9QMG7_ANGAN
MIENCSNKGDLINNRLGLWKLGHQTPKLIVRLIDLGKPDTVS